MKNKLTETEKNRLLTLLRQKDRDKIPPILMPLWDPYRKKIIHGGRGSAKTQTVVRIKIRQASNRRHRVVWARETMESIDDTIYDEIVLMLETLRYPNWKIKETEILNTKTRSKFIFKGLKDFKTAKRNIKGLAHYDCIVVDEAENVLMDSWDMIVPTFREMNSEIWAIFNRYQELDPVYEKFCLVPDPDTLVIECNWRDNPWFPEVLKKEKDLDFKTDYNKAMHIWENHPIAELEEAVMSRILVNDAMNRKVNENGPQVIGVDVARFGTDKTKVYERRGDKCKKLFERFHKEPINVAREVYKKMDHDHVLVNCDNGGLGGGGFIDMLRDCGAKNVVAIDFGGTAKDDKQYANVATEMYFEVKENLKTANIPNNKFLQQDLTGRKYGYDRKIRKQIESKKDFKKRYRRSPDDGDAMVLCFYDSGKRLILPEEDRRKISLKVRDRRITRKSRPYF